MVEKHNENKLVVLIRDHEFWRSQKAGFNGREIIIGSPERIERGNPVFRVSEDSIDLIGSSIAGIQGIIKLTGKSPTYCNMVYDGAVLKRGDEVAMLRMDKRIKLIRGDVILLGHYNNGPEYSITITSIADITR